MYKLNVTADFSAAHKLIGYDGACKNMHGHNWKVRVGILCAELDEIGLTMDFTIVKKHLGKVMDELDHKFLNDLPQFQEKNPTSEHISRYIYQQLKANIAHENCEITDVEVWESEKSSMIYFEKK